MDGPLSCFNLGGDYVSGFSVCNPPTREGYCCSTGDTCLSNRLCQNAAGDMYQGGCTDKTYKSSACPNFCDDPSKYRITLCDRPPGENTAFSDRKYCCDGAEKGRCCSNPEKLFQIDEKMTPTIQPADKYDYTTTAIDGSQTPLASSSFSTSSLSPSIYSPSIFSTLSLSPAIDSPSIYSPPFYSPSSIIPPSLIPSSFSEPTAESIGSSSALSITDAATTSFAIDGSTSVFDSSSTSSQSEAGSSPSSTSKSRSKPRSASSKSMSTPTFTSIPTSTSMKRSTYIRTEPKASQLPSSTNSDSNIGAAVGVTIGTTILLLGLLYLWYCRRYHERRSRRGRPDQGKRLVRVTKGAISLPASIVDPCSLPAGFRPNSNAVAVSIGLAIEMNRAAKDRPKTLAPPTKRQKPPRNFQGAHLSVPSLPSKAETKPEYQSVPTSPSAVPPSPHHSDPTILPQSYSLSRANRDGFTFHPLNTQVVPSSPPEVHSSPPEVHSSPPERRSTSRRETMWSRFRYNPLGASPLPTGPVSPTRPSIPQPDLPKGDHRSPSSS